MIIESDKIIKATNIYAGCVAEFENIWSDNKDLVKRIEDELIDTKSPLSVYWERATLMNDIVSDRRTNTLFDLDKVSFLDKTCLEINNRFFSDVYAAVTWYREHFVIYEFVHESQKEKLTLLRYQYGEEFKAHYDGGTKTGRSISPILYLNDDYEGGELEFVNFGLKIKPKAGSLYLFPANFAYTHIAHPVTKGTKYAVLTFFHDRED
jgi:hypothetical protein